MSAYGACGVSYGGCRGYQVGLLSQSKCSMGSLGFWLSMVTGPEEFFGAKALKPPTSRQGVGAKSTTTTPLQVTMEVERDRGWGHRGMGRA